MNFTQLTFQSFSKFYNVRNVTLPSLPRFPLEFRTEVNHEETRVMGLSYSDDPMIVAGSFWHSASVWRTDGRTDGRIYDS